MLTPQELDKLVHRLSAKGKLFVKFLYATGCRVSEMIGVRLSSCKINGGVTVEVTGKGGKARKVRIPRQLFDEIKATFDGKRLLFETRNRTQYDRSYISHMIERQSKRAIGRMVGAHALRHSAATILISRTNKVQAVSEYLGHSDPATTLRFYVHESLTDEDLRTLK